MTRMVKNKRTGENGSYKITVGLPIKISDKMKLLQIIHNPICYRLSNFLVEIQTQLRIKLFRKNSEV
jgi:hypothetical protein